MPTVKEFVKKLKGPLATEELEKTNEFLLFPRNLEAIKLDTWMLGQIEKDKPINLKFYHKFAGDVFGISIRISEKCNNMSVTEDCITFTNASRRRALVELPEEVVDAALLSAEYKIGQIRVGSSPLNSNIKVDGRETGKLTPQTLTMVVGKHTITLTHEDFEEVSTEVDVQQYFVQEIFLRLPFGVSR